MNKGMIRESLRMRLNEIAGVKYKYGCVMIDFNLPKDKMKELQDAIKDEDVSEIDGKSGRETNFHITLLYGLLPSIKDSDVKKIVCEFVAPEITFDKIDIFENGDVDVVKFNIKDKSLNEMNKQLKKLPFKSDFPKYEAHATIAFVKGGKGKDYIRNLDKPIILTASRIIYSKADGSEKYYNFKNK